MKKKTKNSAKRKEKRSSAGNAKEKQKTGTKKKPNSKSVAKPSATKNLPKKVPEKKRDEGRSLGQYIQKAGQFLRESKMELKKVKWPSRKELLTMTAVVIVLVLFCALYLGLVDFGLIKLIKNIVG
ncbi:MAG TPA: preprotein translocase subunit SecE [Desulfobacteraceae bacterium]|nr:MAG: preprotein translocase subunit SecE [Deltaproteobacteria bacterium]HDZ23542.1 preprotein translocase subunit SecE [Desulfobacteraceae bacterium]